MPGLTHGQFGDIGAVFSRLLLGVRFLDALRRWGHTKGNSQHFRFIVSVTPAMHFIRHGSTRTRTNKNPYGSEANAAGRRGRACVARAVSVERGGMGERGCERRLGEWVLV